MSYKTYKQGVFHPLHSEKYVGKYPIFYRSNLEKKACHWLDDNNKVMKWGIESIAIPYYKPNKDGSPPKQHRYYPDFNVTFNTDKGIQKYIIEIKPYKQTLPPGKAGKKKASTIFYEQYTYAVNQCKWETTRDWCKKNNYKFLVVTEKDLPDY